MNKTIKEKIISAVKYREDFYNDCSTTAFRVFNNSGDGYDGLTIDYFDGFYLITWYDKELYINKDFIVSIVVTLPYYKGVYQKKRFDTKALYLDDKDDFITGDKAPTPLIVKENNVKFEIYLDDGAMTGLFLDQKDVRKVLKEKYSKNKTILNTFSYTGAFSVVSAVGGATKTTSVDLASRSLLKTQNNFKQNNINASTQNIVVQDIFRYFRYAKNKNLSYDVVVLDPPSFARTKKITFSVLKDYTKLLKEAVQITNKNGIIIASTNSTKLSLSRFRDNIKSAFEELGKKFEIIENFSLPKDFKVDTNQRESNYLKVLFIKRIDS
jgi:23S rRNA (cytosine1962-C5)-methyltransferase